MKTLAILGTLAAVTFATPVIAAVVINPGNGHAYEYVSTVGTFEAALAGAASMTYAGSAGYLATVTSKSG
jgi:hypothetical protein